MTDHHSILQALRASAEELTREIDRLPEDVTTWRPAEGEWSQHECLTHLWICEQHIFLPRMRRIVAEDNPALPLVDEVALMQREWNPRRPRAELLREFLADRADEMALLEPADWSRPGAHATRGPITLGWVVDYALAHTFEHMSQMMRVRLNYETRAGP